MVHDEVLRLPAALRVTVTTTLVGSPWILQVYFSSGQSNVFSMPLDEHRERSTSSDGAYTSL